jgi:hypothetical protein
MALTKATKAMAAKATSSSRHTSGSRRQARQHQLADYKGCFVAIILEQPAYALIVPSRPIRFWLLILSLQVLPQNKIKLISSEKKLPQLFDFICTRTERYQKATLSLAAHFVLLPPL